MSTKVPKKLCVFNYICYVWQKNRLRKNRYTTQIAGTAIPDGNVSVFFIKFVREFKKSLFYFRLFSSCGKKTITPFKSVPND